MLLVGLLVCVFGQEEWQSGAYHQSFRDVPFTPPASCKSFSSGTYDKVRVDGTSALFSQQFDSSYAFGRSFGFLQWDYTQIVTAIDTTQRSLVVPRGVIVLTDECYTVQQTNLKTTLRTGTPILSGPIIRVPYVIQLYTLNGVPAECGLVLIASNGTQLNASNSGDVQLKTRNAAEWFQDNVHDSFEGNYALMRDLHDCRNTYSQICVTITSDREIAPNDAFWFCNIAFVQCLSLPSDHLSFDPLDPDVQWVLGEPGTKDHLRTTPRAVDMMLGKISHFALLYGDPDEGFGDSDANFGDYTVLPTNILDLSSMQHLVYVAVQYANNVSIRLPPTTRAFSSISTDMIIDPSNSSLPDLVLYAGSIRLGEPFPIMPSIVTLQISNPLIRFNPPWLPFFDDHINCVDFYKARSHQNLSTCVFASACDNNSFCFNQTEFSNLTSLSLLGIATDLWDCAFASARMPALSSVFIEGSSMRTFSRASSLEFIRLSYNIFLTQVELFPVSSLQLIGNPLAEVVNKINTTATTNTLFSSFSTVDASFSKVTFPSISRLFLSSSSGVSNNKFALTSLTCVLCGLSSFPFSSSALTFPYLQEVNVAYNVIDISLHDLLSAPFWSSLLESVCVLNMTYNSVFGPLPDAKEMQLLFPLSKNCTMPKKIILENNLIESFFSPPFPYTAQIVSIDAQKYLMSFQIFSPDVSVKMFQEKDSLLNLKNNRIKGKISSTDFLKFVDFSSNDVWCDDENNNNRSFSSVCKNTPVLYTSIGYGITNESDFFPLRTPFFPLALSLKDGQSLSVAIFDPSSLVNETSFEFFGKNRPVTNANNILTFNLYNSDFDIANMSGRCEQPLQGQAAANLKFCVLPIVFQRFSNKAIFFSKKLVVIDRCARGRGRGNEEECNSCDVNTYSFSCAHCLTKQPNLMNVASENNECVPCPFSLKNNNRTSVTKQSASYSLNQCVCPELSFGPPATLLSNGTRFIDCVPCTTATTCVGKNITYPAVRDGFFFDGTNFFVCDPQKACKGGDCTAEYTGHRCSLCADDYYRINRECSKCSPASSVLIVVLLLLLVFGLLFVLRSAKTDYTKMFTIPITLAFIQIISVFAAFPVSWPHTTHRMLNFLSFFNFNLDLASPECSIKTTYWGKWMVKLLLPVFVFSTLCLWFLLIKYIPWVQKAYLSFVVKTPAKTRVSCLGNLLLGADTKRFLRTKAMAQDELFMSEATRTPVSEREKEKEWEKRHLSQRFWTASITLLILGYTFLIKSSTQPFNCFLTIAPNGQQIFHLRADPGIECYNETWYQFQPVAIIGIVIYGFGIPFSFAVILIRARQKNLLHDPRFLEYFGGLVLPFRGQFWYWELIQIARKLITVLMIDFQAANTDEHTFGQIAGVLLALVLFFVLQEFVRPYEFTWCNRLEFAWTGMSLVILVAGLVFSFKSLTHDQADAFAAFLIFALACTFAVSLYTFFLEKRRAVIKVGLGAASADKIVNDHEILETALGPDLGDTMYRKMRAMSPQMREKFVARIAALTPSQGASRPMRQRLLGSLSSDIVYGNPDVFPSFAAPESPKPKQTSSAVVSKPMSAAVDTKMPKGSMYEVYNDTNIPLGDLYNSHTDNAPTGNLYSPYNANVPPENLSSPYSENLPTPVFASGVPVTEARFYGIYESNAPHVEQPKTHMYHSYNSESVPNSSLTSVSQDDSNVSSSRVHDVLSKKPSSSTADSVPQVTDAGPSMYTSSSAPTEQ